MILHLYFVVDDNGDIITQYVSSQVPSHFPADIPETVLEELSPGTHYAVFHVAELGERVAFTTPSE